MAMEASENVWDGFELVSKSLEKGIFLCKDVVRFYKKRLEIEEVYSKSLQKAVQKFEPSVLNGFIGTHLPSTWLEIRAETDIQASIHETMATNIKEFICDPFENLILDLEQKYNQFLGEGQKSHADAKESIAKLKKTKIGYDKLYRESMDVGGSASGTMSKRDTQRLQRRTLKLTHELIKADTDYRNQIAETNGFQNNYVKEYVPKLMKLFNKMESVRLHIFKQYLIKYYNTLEELPKSHPNSRQKIIDLLNLSSNEEDITEFLEKNKALLAPPKPFEFEPPADDPPQPAAQVSRRASVQFASPTTSPTISAPVLVGRKTEPIPVAVPPSPSKKDGMFSGNRTRKESSPPVVASMPNSNSQKKDKKEASPSLQTSNSKEKEVLTPTGSKEASKWWFRNKKHSQHELKKSPQKHGVFGVKMEEIMVEQKNDRPDSRIPYLLYVLRDVIIKMDGVRTEGLFRVPGNANDVISFKKQFNEGNYKIETDNVHTAAALFKLWLRELPDPVFPYSIYDKCLNCVTPAAALGTVDQLPEVNKNVLFFVIQLLRDISKFESVNKMGIDNLAMVFAPCLLRSTSSNPASLLENSTKEKEFIFSVIEHLQIPSDSSFIPLLDIDPPTVSSPSTPISASPATTPPQSSHINHLNSELTSSTSSLDNSDVSNSLQSSGVDEADTSGLTKSYSTPAPSKQNTEPTSNQSEATVKRGVSLSAILEEEEAPMAAVLATVPSTSVTVMSESTKGDDSMMMDDDELQAPLVVVASTTFNGGKPESSSVNESHLVRVQVLAEAIATHLTAYLQTLSQSEVSYSKMKHTSDNLDQKLRALDDFLHKVAASALRSSSVSANTPWIHLKPDYKAPPLPASSQEEEKQIHEYIVRTVVQFHDKLYSLVRASEASSSAGQVKAIKNFLKTLKTDVVERRIEKEEPKKEEEKTTSGDGSEEQTEDTRETTEETQGGEDGEEIGTDVLRTLEEHVSSKRELLQTNEDDMSEDDLHDLTDKRMNLARTLSPVKKELDQFCKDCKIDIVGDSRYPVDDMNSEVKFLRKMILHVMARICYLAKEAVAHVQLQMGNKQQAKELHERLTGIMEMLA